MRNYDALVLTHLGAAAAAWANGWIAGRFHERRAQDVADLSDRTQRRIDEFIRMIGAPAPYDWAVDGGGECPDCGGTGETIVADPFLAGACLHAACPTCTRIAP